MKRIIKKHFSYSFLFLLALAGLGSCDSMDEGYKDLIKNGEISYTGKIESLEFFSGKNRAQIKGVFKSDPKITECRIFWNNRKDSISIPVVRTQAEDILDVIIPNLAENNYNFEVITYDKLGNKSIPVFTNGIVYGERYQLSLSNRPIVTSTLVGSKLTINFGTMDTSTGVFTTEVTYTNTSNVLTTVNVPYFITGPINSVNPSVIISDYKNGSFSYRTLFKPDPKSIDTFYSEVTTVTKP